MANPKMPGRANDRRLYILAAILTPLIVLAGFARTYYLKPFFGTPDLAGRIVHVHGIVMTAHRRVAAGIGLVLISAAAAILVAGGLVRGADPTRVEIRIHYSHFDPSVVQVPAGVPVTFVIRNDDPIDHEWIVGDDAVQQRHRTGTEAHHGARPTEVSIPALSTVETTITFAQPVTWRYICHLPSHEAYGMVGTLVVR